ncbi:hypothetical protein ON010_g10296 [Phytophthora cinnamomi]|nr:hypothetical protein ON010_g10296 [Phytophthora cinnamomi]
MVQVSPYIYAIAVATYAAVVSAWPTSTGNVEYSEVYVVAAGETFDGGLKTYQRSDITCAEQDEGGWRDAMFKLEAGATLKNVIIGKNQREGVHCDDHDCTLENVWWEDVCEDALSVKGGTADSVTNVLACGAKNAEDKIIQHNGYGHVNINGFYAENFGKLYRSCGTCGSKKRTVYLNHVWGNNPQNALVTVNSNNGDIATFTDDIHVHSDDGNDDIVICKTTDATDGDEPENGSLVELDLVLVEDAVLGRALARDRGLLAVRGRGGLAHGVCALARVHVDVVGECGHVAVVGVHSHEAHFGVVPPHVVERDGALDVGAGAARAVELAEVFCVKAVDIDVAVSVVLDDLVLGVLGAARQHVGDAVLVAALHTQRVLADVLPPHVLDSAVVVVAVHALALVGSDDDVLELGASLELEDGVPPSALRLALALDVGALVGLHASVECLSFLDDLDAVVADVPLGRGPGGGDGGADGEHGAEEEDDAVHGAGERGVVV